MSAAADLTGKVAVVSGASRGVGRGVALGLAEAGADVVLLSRTAADLQVVAGEVAARGSRAYSMPCDVTDDAQLEQVFSSVPRVDVLVNNAGMNIPESFLDVTAEHFDRIFTLNVRSAFQVTQHAVRRILAHGEGGAVVNLTSQMGHVGAIKRTVYCASKHALEGLTKALAVELAPSGVRVNSVAPTFIETELTRPMFVDEAFRRSVLSQIPLGRIGQVEDVVGAVVFLASPAARMITGTSLLVDGGWTAQ